MVPENDITGFTIAVDWRIVTDDIQLAAVPEMPAEEPTETGLCVCACVLYGGSGGGGRTRA